MKLKETDLATTPVVLLIEDEIGDAELIRWQLLERDEEAFEVHIADSLAQVQYLIETTNLRPDVVLLDLNLPDSTGPKTVMRCRALTGAPIVVLTGLDDVAATQTAIESGAEDYLTKGGEGSALRRAIRYAILRRRRDADARLAASVFSTAREGIMITEEDGTIISVNEAFTRITGYSCDEAMGRNPRFLSSGKQSTDFYDAMWSDLNKNGHWYGEIWNRRKNGELYVEMQTISTVRDPGGDSVHYVSLFSDITSIKEYQKKLEHIAHFDALTGLPNRVLLADRMRQLMALAQRHEKLLAVAFIDLDGFKAINDNHGHEAGDQLLIALATRMKNVLRESDTLARIGGDEFVAVLVDLNSLEDCVPLLTRLLLAAAEPVLFNHTTLQVSASLGVTFYPQEEDIDADQLQRQADQAMYQAKLGGKNRYHVFDAAQDRSLRGHHEIIEHLRRALVEGEFLLYYQPKVNMRTGQVIGAEALIRWQHPQLGLLAPALFLPAVESHPLAIEIGEWVIHTALTQIEMWNTLGLKIPVSVNIGVRQLQQANFTTRVQNLLDAHPHISPSDLEMEIIEASALEDVVKISQVIKTLGQLGIRFAVDDFGTGYSSLTYLKKLAVAALKIDQSFTHNMLDGSDDLAIFEGIMGLTQIFSREAIAEGVETIEHGEMLLKLGCDFAQGFSIAHPMPPDKMPDWVATWQLPDSWVNCKKINPDDLPALYALVEHRAWSRAVDSYLEGASDAPPLEYQPHRFNIFLDTQRLAGKLPHNSLEEIHILHQKFHQLGVQLCQNYNHHATGPTEEVVAQQMAQQHEWHSLCDKLTHYLKLKE